MRVIAETFAQLVTGQMRETRGAADHVDSVEHYLKVVYEKTACLIAASGRFGGTFSGADDEQIERLSRLGGIVGTVFQISDDIIDIDSDPDESGKVPGTDLREGVHTLPVLYALRETGPDADRLRELLAGPVEDDDELAEALALLRSVAAAWCRPRRRSRGMPRRRATSWPTCPTGRAGRRWRRWWTTRSTATAEGSGTCRAVRGVRLPATRA